ncbi:hypothetical protein KTN05_08170 [Paracoccus sp. Z118]|uniref:DUF6766 family protein n=1 Tax=Paracoccus sp. Z118 TaxID=2851017 RepID=UPI001C2BC3FB|nr:DUF6766 family protein [Paracoccus sp. Z118]MBV0891824.1 hypothetical protein [Paracoccus sp. Z118]
MKKYAYFWITAAFFLISIGLHWGFAWFAFVDEAAQHGQEPQVGEYVVQVARDTFENWQSEFLQLIWQVVGLAYFLYVGSPSSKENDDRMEAKVDALIRLQAGGDAERVIAEIDERYYRTHGHAQPHAHDEAPVEV